MSNLSFTLGLLAALSGCAGSRLKVGEADGGEVIEAVGEAMIDQGDPAGTKQRSLADAQKKAVEMVVGVHVSGKVLVEKAMAVEQNILAKTDGYIKKYDVLKEWDEPPFRKTKIRALVRYDQITEDLRAMGLLAKPEVANPRVAVLLTESVAEISEDFEANAGNRAFAQAMLDQGYKVVDRADLLAAKAEEVAKQVEKGDLGGMAKLGSKLDAEIVIFGQAFAQRLESKVLEGLFSYRVTLNAQAFKANTNEILLTVGKVGSGLDASREAAANKALETVGKMAGTEMANKLAAEMMKRASISISVRGIPDLGKLKDFQSALSAMPGVGDYFLRSYDDGKATIDVRIKGVGSQDLASSFERSSRFKAKVTSVTNDTLEVEIQP